MALNSCPYGPRAGKWFFCFCENCWWNFDGDYIESIDCFLQYSYLHNTEPCTWEVFLSSGSFLQCAIGYCPDYSPLRLSLRTEDSPGSRSVWVIVSLYVLAAFSWDSSGNKSSEMLRYFWLPEVSTQPEHADSAGLDSLQARIWGGRTDTLLSLFFRLIKHLPTLEGLGVCSVSRRFALESPLLLLCGS